MLLIFYYIKQKININFYIMGNICEIFSKNNNQAQVVGNKIPIAVPINYFDSHLDLSNNYNNIPVGSPVYDDHDLPSYSEVYPNNNSRHPPQIIVVNQNPYYNDNANSFTTGLIGGMLLEDLLNCD